MEYLHYVEFRLKISMENAKFIDDIATSQEEWGDVINDIVREKRNKLATLLDFFKEEKTISLGDFFKDHKQEKD